MKNKRAINQGDFKNVNIISDPVMLPDGSGCAFVMNKAVDDDTYQSNIYVQLFDEAKTVTPWTFGTNQNKSPRFSPDGEQMVFVSDRSGSNQLWLINTSGGEAEQLTTFKNGVFSPHWSPDGSKIIFMARLEPGANVHEQHEKTKEEKQEHQTDKQKEAVFIDRLQYKAEGTGLKDDKKTQIIMYDIYNKTFQQLTTAKDDHYFQDISPDNKRILFLANLDEDSDYTLRNDLYELEFANNDIKKLTNEKHDYNKANYSPDGEKIVLIGNERDYRGATQDDIYVLEGREGFFQQLSETWDFQIGDVLLGDMRLGEAETGPVWSQDSTHIFFIRSEKGATQLCTVDLEGNLEVLYDENNHVFGFAYDSVTGNFVLGLSDTKNPGSLLSLKRGGTTETLPEMNQSFLDEVELADVEEIVFQSDDDGESIQGWLLKPIKFDANKKYPMILEIHGGPHLMYGNTFFHELQLLAAEGYAVLYINPRGSYGYGQAFVDGCREDYGGQDYRDLMQGVDYALDTFDFIDEEKLGVTGGSYGGFMTNWIVGQTDRFKAAVTQRSISNWLSFYGVSDIGYFFTTWEHELDLLNDSAALWDISPLKYAANVTTPLLIMHGEEDQRCPIEQGEQFYVALKHRKKDAAFVRFPNAGHELSRSGAPAMRIERLKYMLDWFKEYLES